MAKERAERVDFETYMRAWQSSSSVAEVASKTGLTKDSCSTRASGYRKKGIALKSFPKGGGAKLDIAACQALLATLNAEAEQAEEIEEPVAG